MNNPINTFSRMSRREQSALGVLATAVTYWVNQACVYSSLTGAFKSIGDTTTNAQNQIVALAKVLFPFSLVILIIAILFTHDQKALQVELKTALVICVAYAALLIVSGSGFVSTFDTLTSGAGAAAGGGE